MWKSGSLLLKTAALLLALTTGAAAQEFPTKPLRIIVPFPPGAFNDIAARLVATQLTGRLGKQVIVENRAGAGGIIAAESAANAPKDGHTLLIGRLSSDDGRCRRCARRCPSTASSRSRRSAMLAGAPDVVTGAIRDAAGQFAAAELIALAKKQPGKLQYASAGVGTFPASRRRAVQAARPASTCCTSRSRARARALTDVVGGHTQLVVRHRSASSHDPHPLRGS